MKIFILDNYDSFTYNLVQYFGELGASVTVKRNDDVSVAEVMAIRPDRICVSPGPCTPAEAGISVPLITAAAERKIPLLGVCLGHQSIGAAFGGKIVRAQRVMHGKTSVLTHDGTSVFNEITSPYTIIRYHSLVIEKSSCPKDLIPTAHSDDGEIMAVRHASLPIHGVQFHPESILTEHGHALLRNFLELRNI
jgi:anthranilate synthase component II